MPSWFVVCQKAFVWVFRPGIVAVGRRSSRLLGVVWALACGEREVMCVMSFGSGTLANLVTPMGLSAPDRSGAPRSCVSCDCV